MSETNPVQVLDFDQIRIDPERNLRQYKAADIKTLAASIAERGLLQPVVVRPENGNYVLVAGYRRMAALATLRDNGNPVQVLARIKADDEEDDAADQDGSQVPIGVRNQLLDGLAENHDREDMTLMDYANTIRRLGETGMTKKDIAKRLHKSDGWVSVVSKFADFRPEITKRIHAGDIPFRVARELVGKTDSEQDKLIAAMDAAGPGKATEVAKRGKKKKKAGKGDGARITMTQAVAGLQEVAKALPEKGNAKQTRAGLVYGFVMRYLQGNMSAKALHARILELV